MNTSTAQRPYGRTELALRYFPRLSAQAAWRRLRSWIERCAPLTAELRQMGYDGRRRWFTPAEAGRIMYYLGDP